MTLQKIVKFIPYGIQTTILSYAQYIVRNCNS